MNNTKRQITTIIPFRVIQQVGNAVLEFYVHTRYKPLVSPEYSNLYEFPVGGVDENEDSLEAGLRELKEETGMIGNHIYPPQFVQLTIISGSDKVAGYDSFYNLEMQETTHGLLWQGPVFLVRVSSQETPVPNPTEAKDPLWLSVQEIIELAYNQNFQTRPEHFEDTNRTFFDLQLPALRHLATKLLSKEFKSELINLGEQKQQIGSEITSNLREIKPKWYETKKLL